MFVLGIEIQEKICYHKTNKRSENGYTWKKVQLL